MLLKNRLANQKAVQAKTAGKKKKIKAAERSAQEEDREKKNLQCV